MSALANPSQSPALKEFIRLANSLPLAHLPNHLASFPTRWPFPRGDLYNWIDTLDRFDEVLQKVNETYELNDGPQTKAFGSRVVAENLPSDEKLVDLGLDHEGDRVLVQSILLFSRLLLEKCGNRTLYNSTERLNNILNTTSLPLLHEALRLTLVLAQRFADRGPQNPSHSFFYHFELDKLQKLATPIPRLVSRKGPQSPVKTSKNEKKSARSLRRVPTTADPNDFRALARQQASNTQDKADDLDWTQTASLRVVWTDSASATSQPFNSTANGPASPTPLRQQSFGVGNASSSAGGPVQSQSQEEQSDLRIVELVASDLVGHTTEEIIRDRCKSMPDPVKYEFLHKLRTAYGLLDSSESRNMLLYIRLTALGVIGQVYSEDEFTAKYFDGDTNIVLRQQLIQQLVELLRPNKTGQISSLYIQCLAMETLAILSRYRQMSSEILSTLAPNSSHGLLITLVQRGLANLERQDDGTEDSAGDDWRHAVFMLWTIFMSQTGPHNTRAVEQFVHKNLIATYASALRITTQRALRVHVPVLKFLEHIFHHFKDGLQVLNANGAFTIACETSEKLSKVALELYEDGKGIAQDWKTAGVDFKIPYLQQYVLRELIGLVKDVSKHQGNHADRALRGFVDSSSLLNAFRLILSHMEEFGAHTWSEVVVAVCSFLNNEPTSFTVVSEAGIISTLLSTVQPQQVDQKSPEEQMPRTISVVPQEPSLKLPAISDAILNVATSFSAICLTEAGNRQFVSSGVLEKFFELFESPEHVKAIRDSNFLVQLGGCFDELVRHHPGLKNVVVSAIITMIARVRHICRVKLRMIGAGPKLWSEDSSGTIVDGGIGALMSDGLPPLKYAEHDFERLELPNKDVLDFDIKSERATAQHNLARSASDEDSHGLTALDYARPVIGFLAAFFDTHFLCKETLNAGATDLILDLVTLPTLPVTDDSFSEGLLLQDLAAVVRIMADEKPHLVLPLLVDRARYICHDSLTGFINHKASDMQCYFGGYLETRDKEAAMEVDSTATSTMNGTKLVRGLMSIYCIARALSEVFGQPSYSSRQHHNTTLAHVNIADIVSEVIELFGKLSAACGREEISILASVPKAWLDATKPGNYTTGDADVDTILDLSDNRKMGEDDIERVIPDDLKDVENTAAFRNLRSLRHLLTETPAAISAFFSRISSSFSGRKKPETFFKQKLVSVAESIAQALTFQLQPPFLSRSESDEISDNEKDWRFKYFTVVLSRVRDSLWEDNGTGPAGATCQPFIMECFRRAKGMGVLTEIGKEFVQELSKCKFDKPLVFAANAGLKICLEILEDTTRSELVGLPQATYMKNVDPNRPFLFNPNQLLLELRSESLKLAREIWDSEYAEQASADVVRRLAAILKHTLQGDNEDGVIATADDHPKLAAHVKRLYSIDKAKVKHLVDKGYGLAEAEEALYRCNVSQNMQLPTAEEYCLALKTNSRRRRLPAPRDEIKSQSAITTPPSHLTSPPIVADAPGGPTTTILEDSSQDEDIVDVLDISRADTNGTMGDATPAPEAPSAMDLSVMLNEPAPVQSPPSKFSRQSIDAERESIRETLAERCNNILSNHPKLIFELHDLLISGAAKLAPENMKEWWTATTDILVSSLLSQSIGADVEEAQGKKVAATAHLIGLLSTDPIFQTSMIKAVQESFDNVVDFLKIPGQKASDGEAHPWISPILLIIEKMLDLETTPDRTKWTPPNDVDNWTEPELIHDDIVPAEARQTIFERLVEIMPKVGKDSSMALALSRVLLILTRHRDIALEQGQKRNLQRLFLMVKQLNGRWGPKLQGCIMTILRHVVEDDSTIKQIMTTEIMAYFKNKSTGRSPDLQTYTKDLQHLALRSPALFVEVSNQHVKLLQWSPGHQAASAPVGLRAEDKDDAADKPAMVPTVEPPAESIGPDTTGNTEQEKATEVKMPIVEKPDGIIHFILTELLAYKDIEDKEPSIQTESTQDADGVSASTTTVNGDSSTTNGTAGSAQAQDSTGKAEKPRFKADDHPIFLYRSFLLHCLTELLHSYNQTKIEFISFSRKNDPYSATPSKARSGVLNYLLNALVSSGYVDKDESIACRKKLVTSGWAMQVLVGLCSKTGEKDLGLVSGSRYANAPRQIDDKDTEPDLTYVRKFVLDHAIKSFRDATTSTEPTQARYGRLLCLAELFYKLITKASPQEGSVPVANTSYKRIARMMLEKNFIAVLTSAISDIDLSVPGAKKVIKFILRPLKELTATATDLNINHPDQFPQIVDMNTDAVSDASSQVSDVSDDREETPDLYRNSALGMLDPARRDHHSDTEDDDEDDEDEDDEMGYDDYDEDMDYDGMGAPPNGGEVVSDEELEDAMDGPGEMEGLPGDVPMDIQFVVDRHHHHHEDDDEDDSESDSDDDDESDEDDDGEDIEIEMEDDDENDGEPHEGGEDEWEDEEDGEDEDDDGEVEFAHDDIVDIAGGAGGPAAHISDLLNELRGAELATGDVLTPPTFDPSIDPNLFLQHGDPADPDDEDDQEDDGDDIEDEEMGGYDQPFDMMLNDPGYDENEEWGWDEPPQPIFRRPRHARAAGFPNVLGGRRVVMNDPEGLGQLLGGRHHRHAPSARPQAGEEDTHPLLQRPSDVGGMDFDVNGTNSRLVSYVPMGADLGGARGGLPPFLFAGGNGGPAVVTMDGSLGGGHGAILDAIMGAIQRGDPEQLAQNGQIRFNLSPPALEQLLRPPPMPIGFSSSRQPKEDPQRSATFMPMSTITRWQQEVQIVFGKNAVTAVQPVQTWVYAVLVPLAQSDEKERRRKAEEERKAAEERETQRKAEEERLRKEEEERQAKEKAEAEERARLAAEQAAEHDTQSEDEAGETEDAMEDVQEGGEEGAAEATEEPSRRYTTIRGRQLDITGLDIDVEYLEALPEDLREEVITAQYQARREQAQEQGNDDSAIDQEFLDALPEDIREEIRAQEAAAQRRRDRERARREAQAQAGGPPADMEPDDFLASLEPALRRAILAEQPQEILNALNPQHAAEGRAHARSILYHRSPMAAALERASGRDREREARRQQIVQLIDNAGVATLLRLMFIQQQGSLKANLLNILSQVCGNRQTRYQVVSLLLVVLKEGSTDVTAIERSLASLSLRAKGAGGAAKTPQPLKRTLSMQPHGGLSEEVTPIMVVQQCLHALSYICTRNAHVKNIFLREADVTSANKNKNKSKGKSKESRTTTHPVNDLISLLDRQLIMDNSGCLHHLASLLAVVTNPLGALMRQEKERQKAEKAKEEKAAQAAKEDSEKKEGDDEKEDVAMVDVPGSQEGPKEEVSASTDQKDEAAKPEETPDMKEAEQDKRKPFDPPTITEHNLKLITNIFVAAECGQETFKSTLEILRSLSHIPGTSEKFGKELTSHVHTLSQAICSELDELLPAIRDAQSSMDVQGAAAARFSASTSDQVKLLRVLQALDYTTAPRRHEDVDQPAKSILTLSYEHLGLGSLWLKLGECLTAVEEKGDTISFANILLPLIESLMVVCKHTTLKDTPVQVKEAALTSPVAPTYHDELEELFFKFTSDHRKILNDIVRQNPKLMQGQFAILAKNSKVLDFDNKRQYFNKQIHSRHHAQRHPQPPLQLNVRREQVFIDSYKALYFKSADEMKYGKLNIRFNGEEGVDAGGVTREWFQVLARGMFDPNYALFQPVASDKTTFHPSALSKVNDEHLLYFKFIGRIIGKALHEGRVLDCHFSRAVYKRILGKKPNLKDLESNDVDYYKSLCWILENDITDILTEEFCVIEDEFGEEKIIDLIEDGRNIAVTEENKKEYVQALVEYRLTESVKDQLDNFLTGFHDIIPAELIAIFNEQELELLISGLPEIDVDDWKANTEYHNYNPASQQVVWFWRIVKAMTNEERAKLLQFITGTSKVPLNGFKELEGVSGLTKCNIHKDPSTNRLPTSHTCFNQLDLPAYESFEIMKQNITTAINLGADYFGFA